MDLLKKQLMSNKNSNEKIAVACSYIKKRKT